MFNLEAPAVTFTRCNNPVGRSRDVLGQIVPWRYFTHSFSEFLIMSCSLWNGAGRPIIWSFGLSLSDSGCLAHFGTNTYHLFFATIQISSTWAAVLSRRHLTLHQFDEDKDAKHDKHPKWLIVGVFTLPLSHRAAAVVHNYDSGAQHSECKAVF